MISVSSDVIDKIIKIVKDGGGEVFEKEGYITETEVEGRKRTYALTPRGAGAFYEELTRLRMCVADAEKGGDL